MCVLVVVSSLDACTLFSSRRSWSRKNPRGSQGEAADRGQVRAKRGEFYAHRSNSSANGKPVRWNVVREEPHTAWEAFNDPW